MAVSATSARWERVYIFISSTFNDMHAERDYLVKKVFPQLADWCELRRLRMVDIDLRWGVTELDATRNRSVVDVCLGRIDECRPFFICLLGQRYGWIPAAGDVSPGTFGRFPGLAEVVDEGRSVTELEILHAIVSPFGDGESAAKSEHAFFYQRHPASLRGIPGAPPQLWRTFSDAGELDAGARHFLLARRKRLRKQTIPATGRPVTVYRGTWNARARTPELELPLRTPAVLPENIERWRRQWSEAGVRVEGLDVAAIPGEEEKARAFNERLTSGRLGDFTAGVESLASRIQRDLRESIEARFPGRVPQQLDTPLAVELSQQEQFQFAAAEGFVERAGDFTALDQYSQSDSDRPFVLTAPGGAGKSMLLARWIERLRSAAPRGAGRPPIYRFIGASDQSASVTSVVGLLMREILDAAGRRPEEVPADPVVLRQVWPDLLREVGALGPVHIVIDALDQLQSGLADLTWIPGRLPPNVKMVVSFRSDAPRGPDAIERFRQGGAVMSEVRPLVDLDDRRRLVRAYLAQYLKELDEWHLESLIAVLGAGNPLFLKVALGELRVFGSFAALGERIDSDFGSTPESAFAAVLRRLETDPSYTAIEPGAAVPSIFGLLAHARRGLSAEELAILLCTATGRDRKDPLVWDAATGTTYLALRQVRPYIARRQGRFDFFYETFRISATEKYTDDSSDSTAGTRTSAQWHALLADYFHSLPLWSGSGVERAPNTRKVSELPYHLAMAGDGKRLGKVLSDLDFMEAKCAAGLTYDLAADYARVPAALRTAAIEQFGDFVRANAHVLARWPELTFQQAANTVLSKADGQSAPAKAAVYRQVMGLESRPWIRRLNPVPTAGACVMTLAGHAGAVIGVAVTPDGSRAISAGVDRTLRVWDLESGGAMEIARGIVNVHKKQWDVEGTAGLAIVPASALVAVVGPRGRIVLWDFDQLQPVGELEGPRDGATCIAVDSTGRWLIAGTSADAGAWAPLSRSKKSDPMNSIVIYDLTTQSPIEAGEFSEGVDALALGADAKSVVLASGTSVRAYDPRARRTIATAVVETQQITRIRFAPDGRTVAVSAWGGEIRLLDCVSLRLVRCLHGRQQGIAQDITFAPDGGEIAAAGLDGTIKLWDVASGESRTTLRGHKAIVTGIAFTPDGKRIVTSSADGTVKVWDPQFDRDFVAATRRSFSEQYAHRFADLDPDRLEALVEGLLHRMSSGKHLISVTGVASASSNRRAITVSVDDALRIWSLDTGECEHALEEHRHGIWEVTTSSDGRTVASSDGGATIKIWDVDHGKEVASRTLVRDGDAAPGADFGAQVFREMQRPRIWPLRFAVGDRVLLSADNLDHDIKAWDSTALNPLFRLSGHRARIREMAVSRDGMGLVSSSEDGEVIKWDLAGGGILARGGYVAGGNVVGQLGPMAIIPGGPVACAWPDGSIHLLDPGTLAERGVLGDGGGRVMSITACGDTIAVARADGPGTIIEIWRGTSGRPAFVKRFTSDFVRATCNSDGRRFAIGGAQETLTLYDLEHSDSPRRYPEPVSHFTFAGDRIVAGNEIGDVFLLEPVA